MGLGGAFLGGLGSGLGWLVAFAGVGAAAVVGVVGRVYSPEWRAALPSP